MITIEQMVQREIDCGLSSLVSTLNCGFIYRGGESKPDRDLQALIDQASELVAPVLDYEEAARQEGWHYQGEGTAKGKMSELLFCNPDDEPTKSWEQACALDGLDPYEREVFEHWSVSRWFADKLLAQGEKVDTDFAGLCIWARTTTGQGITMDGCIQRIYVEMMGPADVGASA